MVVPVSVTITNLNVNAGDHFLPANGQTIPSGYTQLSVALDLSNWQLTDNIFVFASYSTDNGSTWADNGGIETNGGPHFAKDGVTPALPNFTVAVPSGTGVKVRAHYIVPSTQQISGSLGLS